MQKPVLFENATPNPANLESLQEGLGWLNSYLEGQSYVTGSDVTIADHALLATASSIEASGNAVLIGLNC